MAQVIEASINENHGTALCLECGKKFNPSSVDDPCPNCGSGRIAHSFEY